MTGPKTFGVEGPVKVLELIKTMGSGGAERLLVERLRAAPRGSVAPLDVEVATIFVGSPSLLPEASAVARRAHVLGDESFLDPRWVFRLVRLLRRGRFDVVHVHSPAVSVVLNLVVRVLPRRPEVLVTEHNTEYRPVTRVLHRVAVRMASHVVAVSAAVRDGLPRMRTPVSTIVHGVDVGRADAAVAHRELAMAELGVSGGPIVVTVANLRPQKDLEVLLRAARVVVDAIPGTTFHVAGEGPERPQLERLRRDLGLDTSVVLHGSLPNAIRLTALGDLFVLSSLHEGLPVAVMESIACGVPVVATDVGGLRELVVADETGWLVPAGDHQALAARVREALTDESARRAAARACWECRSEVDIASAASAIADLCHELGQRRRQRVDG